MKKLPFPFELRMSRGQLIFGLVYLPFHIFILPLFLPALLMEAGMTDLGEINLVYYALSFVLVLAVFWSYLRGEFDPLVERLGHCLLTFLMALGLDYVLSLAVNSVVLAVTQGVDNPNDTMIGEIALESGGTIKAAAIFMAPIVEEVLFRGVIFGGVRRKNRLLAYVLSVLMFSVYHVWQYVAVSGDLSLLIYVLQYLPVSIVLAWAYERSGSLWVPIGFHMMINSMSFVVEKMLAELPEGVLSFGFLF